MLLRKLPQTNGREGEPDLKKIMLVFGTVLTAFGEMEPGTANAIQDHRP